MATIAARTLSTALGDMRVELDAPARLDHDYACVYRLVGPRTHKRGRAMGVDGFQALQLALERIAADLRASPEFEAGPIQWLDMDHPGFRLPDVIEDLGWRSSRDEARGSPGA